MRVTRSALIVVAVGVAGVLALAAPARAQVHEHVDVQGALLTPTQEATGTSWVPASTPMRGAHLPWRGWDARLSGDLFALVTYEPTERHRTGGVDTTQISGVTWGMTTIRRGLGSGRFGVRSMLSADPWTASDCGPLSLLATGEVCEGDTVHDRQQPHDFVMELAADYEHPLRGRWRLQIYAGLAGEPALGPPGYSHRTSAGVNPIAPISHHVIDPPTAFGVLTGGLHNGRWKIEASAFNGRSADESRVDLDLGTLDSAAARITFLPTPRLAVQVSAGRSHEAASDFYGQPQNAASKVVASATYHRPRGDTGIWATTVAYGLSEGPEVIAGSTFDILSDALLVETALTTRSEKHTVYGRAEIAGMPAHHLHAHEFVESVFTVGKLQAGYARHFKARAGMVPGIGASISLAMVTDPLAPRYDGNVSSGWTVFLNFRPARHAM